MEEFKKCVPTPIKIYLEEQKIDDLQKAAILADDYKLTYKSLPQTSGMSTITTGNHSDLSHPKQRKLKIPTLRGLNRAYCKQQSHLMSECWTPAPEEEEKYTN